MPYDEALADRARDVLAARAELTEIEMFGGICFMLAGNMACGVIKDDLLVRLAAEEAEQALEDPHARPMDFTGRPMKNVVYVDPEGTASDQSLASWVEAGADFAASLPAKRKK
jgi:TfoX/Sxy family transcriptional regulator of competence genes